VGATHLPGRRQPRKRRLRFIVSAKNRKPASRCVPPGIDSSAVSFAAQSGSGLAIFGSRRFAWQDIEGGKRCRGLARVLRRRFAACRLCRRPPEPGARGPRLCSERRFAAASATRGAPHPWARAQP